MDSFARAALAEDHRSQTWCLRGQTLVASQLWKPEAGIKELAELVPSEALAGKDRLQASPWAVGDCLPAVRMPASLEACALQKAPPRKSPVLSAPRSAEN